MKHRDYLVKTNTVQLGIEDVEEYADRMLKKEKAKIKSRLKKLARADREVI